jgi:hypothetical protein
MPSSVLLASPTPIPPPDPPPVYWQANRHEWAAWDGTVWDISQGISGVVLQAGVRGMHMPPIQRYSSKMPALAGSIWRGAVTDEREVFWPVKVYQDNSTIDWISHNQRFWHGFRPDQTGLWSVIQPDANGLAGERRSLRVRFASEDNDADDIAPELQGWAVYGINLIAESPYWCGDTVTKTFQATSPTNYYGPTGYGPPFYISSGLSAATASITNPGDVEAWPVWTIYGPTTSVSVGLGGRAVTFPMSIAANSWVALDSSPTSQQALTDTGVDVTAQLGTVDFAPIPPGTEVPLTIAITGTGQVAVSILPRYYRAY